MTMGTNMLKSSLLKAGMAASVLILTSAAALAQSAVTLTATPTATTLPDGQVVPMWGLMCGATADAGATVSRVSCTAANGTVQSGTAWQPPLIKVPSGQALSITLVDGLGFTAGTGANAVPTSLMIVGQIGGGLGDVNQRATMPSPAHAPQGTTWPGTRGTIDPATLAVTVGYGGAGYVNPPAVTILGGGGGGAAAVATIANGTVTGVIVSSVGSGYTAAPTVTIAPPACTPLQDPATATPPIVCSQATAAMNFTVLQSSDGSATFVPPPQADRVRSFGTEVNVSDGTAGKVLTWNNLRPGTYLIESGTEPSIQGPMGLYGVLVVTEPDGTNNSATAHQAYGTFFDQDEALLFSEIDPVQNAAVDQAVRTAGFSDALVWNGQAGMCGEVTVHTCYPPAVNYAPLYYLINGLSFDRTNATASTLTVANTNVQGNLLLRLVNAGLRMHVPSVVGAKMTLLAEDGNKLPGNPRLQSEVLLTAGKTYDVAIQPAATSATTYADATYPVFDRALDLSTGNLRDGGMQVYLKVGAGSAAGGGGTNSGTTLSAVDKTFYCVAGSTLSVTDPTKGLLAGAVGANGVSSPTGYSSGVSAANLTLNSNGTFVYSQDPTATSCGGGFTYLVNGTQTHTATIAQCDANSTSSGCSVGAAPVVADIQFTSNVATRYASPPPGVLAGVTSNPSGQALTAAGIGLNADGSFVATSTGAACPTTLSPAAPAGATCVAIPYQAKNAQGVASNTANAIVIFMPASNLAVNVKDAKNGLAIADYRWIIEEDRTFWVDPKCQINSLSVSHGGLRPDSCPPLPVESSGYNFHTAHMPVVAEGCVGTTSCEAGQTVGGTAAVCDIGNGVCRTDAAQFAEILPGSVHLDSNKRYFISVLPGDGVNPTIGGAGGPDANGKPFTIAAACGAYDPAAAAWVPGGANSICGHEMGGSQIAVGQTAVNIALQETPLPTAKISVLVFQDDNPLNGENDAGGGVDVLAPNEPGLGGFEIKLFDQAGQLGDNTGQVTYDQFNQPLSNSLAGYIDPVTGLDACPITRKNDGLNSNLVGMIPTCPKYESDGATLSPLAGQVIIDNLFPGLYEIQAYPAADRIGKGEEWLQTNTLDGGKPHEAFIKPNEPGYFQEFGPGGYHVAIGFANQKIINARKASYCAGATGGCNSKLTVHVSNTHMSRSPDQRTYSSGTYDHYSFTNCYVSIGPADSEDFELEKCTPDGTAVFSNIPAGTFKISVFDQWNDIMLDGLVGTVVVNNGSNEKTFPATQWRTNLYTRTFIDTDGTGVSTDAKPGLALVNTNIRYRDGSIGFFNNTDLNGYAGFNEVFPYMNWLVVDTSSTRYKATSAHVVYDTGGPVDCAAPATYGGDASNAPPCSIIAANIANTKERVPLPADLRVPGARYCAGADCPAGDTAGGSSGVVVPTQAWGNTIGWQGLLGQNTFIEFGVKPFAPSENGGIAGDIIYASTRPFDDPSLSLQLSWEPGVPNVKVNLYSQGVDAQGNPTLTLVDTTTTTSFDDWAQGFRKDASGNLMQKTDGSYIPNMNCPGQDSTSPFFATLKGSKQWLDTPDVTGNKKPLAYNAQFKCYDGWSQLNQAQPAPYDGRYKFPSVTAVDPLTGKPSMTNCTGCSLQDADGNPMLPPGKYVVEVIVPQGYELVKEEDKNILLGDVFIAPVTQQFAGFGSIFIMPDQAAVNAHYNPNNPGALNLTNNQGSVTFPRHEGDTGSVESYWPCVGAERIVPDLMSLFPGAGQAAPFAGAKRTLCDRKEVVLQDQAAVLAKFFVFSSTHIAGHFTGLITNDFASEFDPFSPQFGEKFGPPNLPVGLRDFNGNEVARVYSDQWGVYNGLYFSSWTVNPPNPTGYAPQMSIACMNDPGPIADGNGGMITDPAYNPAYSDFCYEQPFMPGATTYMDTPVIPTQSFADGYNLPDTEYPDGTPAIKMVVNSDSSMPQGPWVRPATTAARASASFTVSGVARCTNSTCTGNGRALTTITFPNGVVTCSSSGNNTTSGPNCSNSSGTTRNNNVATYIRFNIATLMGAGYTASGSNANVTVTAPATGSSFNGTTVIADTANLSGPNPPVLLEGGADTAAAAMGITITALGDKVVQNPIYSGPNATNAPYNQKTITRHYGFGGTAGTAVLVAPDGTTTTALNVPTNGWSDTQISTTIPTLSSAYNCKVQQMGSTTAQCGQLVITAGNGKRSVDAITVNVGGTAPWVVTETDVTAPTGRSVHDYGRAFGRLNLVPGALHQDPIQVALDSAAPGDLILVRPGTYRENLVMWKPVRLQGVGAASVTVNADAHPAGHMDQWRRQMVCVFGLTLDGITNLGNDQGKFDPSGLYACPDAMFLKGDRIPFEAITGWNAAGNGNLAQLLQEPTLMGAYEGAGITVVGRGVREPEGTTDFWGNADPTAAGAFPDGGVYLTSSGTDCAQHPSVTNGDDYGTSNYRCNPSRIDGLSILNSSQGGGGLFVHGWSHNLEISNNRISANHGTLAGAVNLGNGETPPVYLNDGTICGNGVATPAPLCPPIPDETPTGATIPFGFNTFVRIHHNMLWNNASIGDALFTGTPAGAGGVTVSSGGDNYQIDHNWIAGNLSTGDGGGVQSLGVSFNGKIANNVILFNQSTNPTLPTNGGGIVIQGANEPRTLNGAECGTTTDVDCPPGLGDGTGDGLVIDSNLIYGNSAESGTGGGIALEQINGSEMIAFPTTSSQWYGVTVTNNIIANNVAGYDGGGVSMRDALKVSLINNTIVSNDATATAGVLFKTLGAINASNPPPGCNSVTDPTLPQDPSCLGADAPHGPQPSGLVTMLHTQNLNDAIGALPGSVTSNGNPKVTCPSGYGYANGGTGNGNSLKNADCLKFSRPTLVNNLFWQNRTFSVDITVPGSGLQSQQNLVALSPQLNQLATGACPSGAQYWDVGLRTDDVNSGLITAALNKLAITNSILTGTGDIGTAQETVASGSNQVGVANPVIAQICNGARTAPESCSELAGGLGQSCHGFNSPPGASETTGLAQVFVFNQIQPTATVDEGHNWLNLTFGPLSLMTPTAYNAKTTTPGELMVASASVGVTGSAYSVPTSSAAVGHGTRINGVTPTIDFFGQARPNNAPMTIGAVHVAAPPAPIAGVSPASLAFGTRAIGTTTAAPGQYVTLSNGGTADLTVTVASITVPSGFVRYTGGSGTNKCATTGTITVAAGGSCRIYYQFAPTSAITYSGNSTIPTNDAANPTLTVALSGTGAAPPTLSSIVPNSGARPTGGLGNLFNNYNVTLTGTNLAGATGVNVSGSSVFATNVAVVNAQTVTARLTVLRGTLFGNPTGAHNVTVTAPAGTTNAVTFTVTP